MIYSAAYYRTWRLANPDKVRAADVKWKAANQDKRHAYEVKRYAANRDKLRAKSAAWRLANPGKARAWQAANPEKTRAITVAYRAAKLRRIPVWADLKQIRNIYAEAQAKILCTGEPWHVDHVIPLQGKLVSGLHIHTNLQILRGVENRRKHNRYEV